MMTRGTRGGRGKSPQRIVASHQIAKARFLALSLLHKLEPEFPSYDLSRFTQGADGHGFLAGIEQPVMRGPARTPFAAPFPLSLSSERTTSPTVWGGVTKVFRSIPVDAKILPALRSHSFAAAVACTWKTLCLDDRLRSCGRRSPTSSRKTISQRVYCTSLTLPSLKMTFMPL